jgi:hypothetical protein
MNLLAGAAVIRSVIRFQLFWLAVLFASGCVAILPSNGGGKTSFQPPRQVNASDIALPAGYRIEALAVGLTFPSGATLDALSEILAQVPGLHVDESGAAV